MEAIAHIGYGEAPAPRPALPLIPRDRIYRLALALTLLTALILRAERLRQPFFDMISWRQSSTAMMAENFYRTHLNIFYPQVNWVGTDTGYQGREFQTVTYIAAALYRVFGQEDWIGRGVCALFGVWGVFALYQVVRRAWDETHALVAAAVMAMLPGSIWIDRAFLPDPAMLALVMTSLWMLLEHLRGGRTRYLELWAIIGAWGCATKPPGMVSLIAMGPTGSEALAAGLDPILDPRPAPVVPVAFGSMGVRARLGPATLTYDAAFNARELADAAGNPAPLCAGRSTAPHVYQHSATLGWDSPCKCFKIAVTAAKTECDAKPHVGIQFGLQELSGFRFGP